MKPASKCPTPGCTRPLLRTTGLCAECSADACRPELPSDGSLTFAEAMALDPSEVEIHIANDVWGALDEHKQYTIGLLRMRKFRRSRPKRSRVEEMACHVDGRGDDFTRYAAYDMERAIRAVCEWLSPRYPSSAKEVEREFLEKR